MLTHTRIQLNIARCMATLSLFGTLQPLHTLRLIATPKIQPYQAFTIIPPE